MKIRIILILFGITLGLLTGSVTFGAWWIFANSSTHFSSISALHESMVTTSDTTTKAPNESVSLRSIITPHPRRDIIYELRSDLRVKFQGVPVRTNSCGMRGPEVPFYREPRSLRIALLGDSFAFGWGVEEHLTFAAVLQESLLIALKGRFTKVEVLNFGVPGYSTFQEVAAYEERGRGYSPDAIIVYFVENDFGLPFFLGQASTGLMSAVNFASKVWNSPDPAAAEERKFLQSKLNPNKALQALSNIAAKDGIPVFLAINPGRHSQKDREKLTVLNRSYLKGVASNRAVNIIELPIDKRMNQVLAERGIKDKKSLSLPTDPHPSPIKHEILGHLLSESLIANIAEISGSES